MKTVQLSYGYSMDVFEDGSLILKNSKGYIKLSKFIHQWEKYMTEYGDFSGNRFDDYGHSLVEGKPDDEGNRYYLSMFDFDVHMKITFLNRYKECLRSFI